MVGAQGGAAPAAHNIVRPRDLKWTPMQLPGAEMAVVSGDPGKAAPFVIRIKMADGTRVPPHWHPGDEHITVMRGVFAVGMGILYDENKLEEMQPAMYAHVPKEMRHFALAKGETVVQVHGLGPFVVNWVNPSDLGGPVR
jgi:anti-sigma factor ChrR (cupin superfamily)